MVGASAARPFGIRGATQLWHATLSDPLAEAIAVVALCPFLLAVAFWNRFPIIFYDTGAYVLQGLGGVFLAERSPVYSIFLLLAGAKVSLWLVVLAQALLTAFVIVQVARVLAPRLPMVLLVATIAALAVVTGLPWYVGQIQPDCFAALTVLGIYLLGFHWKALGKGRGIALIAATAIAVAAHASHLVLATVLLVGIIAYKIVALRKADGRWPLANIRWAAMALGFGTSLVILSNFIFTQQIFISRAGPVFVFARMMQDGIVMRLLDDTCPQSHYRLCAYRDELPRTADQWLWGVESPFQKLHRFAGTRSESERMIWDSLERYPLMQLGAATNDAARQFATFSTGDQIEPQQWILYSSLDKLIPRQMRAYLTARQQRAGIDFAAINRLHVPFAWLSLLALLAVFAFAIRRGWNKESVLLGFVLAALLANAAICGALSNPHARYQSRLIWLAPFALALVVARRPNEPGQNG